MLLVLGEEASILGDLDLDLRVFVTVGVQQVQRGVQDRNRLFVSVHILLVGVRLCLDLLRELVHEVGEYFVHLLAVSLRALGSFRLASVFDHTNGSVHLSYPQLGNTQQAQDWQADIELPD